MQLLRLNNRVDRAEAVHVLIICNNTIFAVTASHFLDEEKVLDGNAHGDFGGDLSNHFFGHASGLSQHLGNISRSERSGDVQHDVEGL